MQKIEIIKKTDWVSTSNRPAWDGSGISGYRVWMMFDGLRYWQRHEWKKDDGATNMEDWIPSPLTKFSERMS